VEASAAVSAVAAQASAVVAPAAWPGFFVFRFINYRK